MKKHILLVLVVAVFLSCKKEDLNNCSYNGLGEGRYVFCSDTVAVGDTIFVTLAWENNVPCQTESG